MAEIKTLCDPSEDRASIRALPIGKKQIRCFFCTQY